MYLAQNLKYLRESKGIKQEEMSNMIGVEQGTISSWENGNRKPCIDMIVVLAKLFEVSLDNLILNPIEPPAPLYAMNLRYLRRKKEISQDDMAKFLGFSGKSSLSAVETGKVGISVENLEKISDFFGVTMDQLVKTDLSKEDAHEEM